MKSNKDFTICQKHNFCIDNLKEVLKIINKHNLYEIDYEIISLIKETIQEIRLTKKDGQRMENRLKKYARSIELLGYERTRKEEI
jgi:hypothetical protein